MFVSCLPFPLRDIESGKKRSIVFYSSVSLPFAEREKVSLSVTVSLRGRSTSMGKSQREREREIQKCPFLEEKSQNETDSPTRKEGGKRHRTQTIKQKGGQTLTAKTRQARFSRFNYRRMMLFLCDFQLDRERPGIHFLYFPVRGRKRKPEGTRVGLFVLYPNVQTKERERKAQNTNVEFTHWFNLTFQKGVTL